MSYIRWFQDIRAADIELVGGKGANLGEMTRAGIPVPPGFCLTALAYRDFIAQSGLFDQICEILAQADLENTTVAGNAAQCIRDLILQQSIHESMQAEILDAYYQLGNLMALTHGSSIPVAVRSSATAEDLPTASFAGQQDTYLNIQGEEALLEHVKSCWSSLWTSRAVSYRTKQKFDHQKVYLCVVVQAMVPSEVSGILFTANPVNGDRRTAVINASWGLGEAIVSGLVTPDTLAVNKDNGEVTSRRTASKDLFIGYSPSGGVVQQDVPMERRAAAALSDMHAAELVKMGSLIEKHYGAPQDIEWAKVADRWYILQVRPITTLPKVNEESSDHEYNRSMFVEIFPDPLTPSFGSVVRFLFESMLIYTFKTWGFQPPEDMEGVKIFYNQPYFSRKYIETAFAPLSPPVRDILVGQIVNPFGDHKNGSLTEFSLHYLRMFVSMVKFMLEFPHLLPNLIDDYQLEVANIDALQAESLTDPEIAAHIKELVHCFTRKLIDLDFLLIATVKRVYHLLGSILKPYFGTEAEILVGKLISGVTGNKTMVTNINLWDLSQLAKASPSICQLFNEYSGPELIERLRLDPDGRAFMDEMGKFLKLYGHREVRLDIIYPTWVEDPSPVLNFIRGYLEVGNDQNPRLQQEKLIRQRQEIKEQVRAKLLTDVKGRFFLWPLFHWLLDTIEYHTRERDTVHFEMTRIFPSFRRLLFELGRRWVASGYLTQVDQVFFLTLDEIMDMADQPHSADAITSQRQREYEANKNRSWPEVIRGDQELQANLPDTSQTSEGRLDGVPGSPGKVTGKACVVRGPEEFERLQKGDILIAPITNPVWTPLFAIASGVITEVGGILSHGAIVAREYGIPAVMSIAGATRQISDGQVITVDGDRGMVYLEVEASV